MVSSVLPFSGGAGQMGRTARCHWVKANCRLFAKHSLRDQRGRHHLLAASVPDEEPVEFMIIATRRYTITYLDIIDGHVCVAFALLFLHI